MNLLNNERGSGIFITIFYMAFVGVVLILIINFAFIYNKKTQASNAAEQASLAATSVVYEKINYVVDTHVKVIILGIDENGISILKHEPLIDKVNSRENTIRNANPSLSNNEIHIQAVNEVLLSEIPDDAVLAGKITDALHSAKTVIGSVIGNTIHKNGGKTTDFEYYVNDHYQIEVIAKTEFEPSRYSNINFGEKKDIPQKGIGPKISFLQVSGW